jgi:tetratricopeptide (TPR) repeat protein
VLAEQQLTKLVEKEPGEVLRLAALKGRHGGPNKLDEALGMCEQSVRDGVPPVRAAAEVVAMLRAHDELDSTSTQFQRAEKWLEALAAASPKDYALLSRIAEFHDMAGHSSRVKELYRTILDGARLRPQDKGMILNNLAYVHALDGEGNEALSLVNNAIQLFGPTTDLLDTRGYAYLQLNQVDKAITDFQQAISGGGKTAHKLFHLALAQERNRDDASAEKSWREALGLGLEENQLPRQLRDDYLRLRAKFGELAMREKAFN